MIDKIKCCELVPVKGMNFARYRQCSRGATTEHEGKGYCKAHHPVMAKAKKDAEEKARHAEITARFEKHVTNAKKIAVHDALVAALEAARSELWRLLDVKGVEPQEIRRWPEIVSCDAALALAKKATS